MFVVKSNTMKRLLLFLWIATVSVSCIDKDYDLSDLNTDNIAIGDNKSEFTIPLATIHISLNKLGTAELNIKDIYEEADIWLPNTTPDGKEYFDVVKLTGNQDNYLGKVVDALCEQLSTDHAKRTAIAHLIETKYANEFNIAELPGNVTIAQFIEEYYDQPLFKDVIASSIKQISGTYLSTIQIDPISYDIPPIDIADNILDMITKGLDPQGATSSINAIYLYGEVHSDFSIDFEAAPSVEHTDIVFAPFMISYNTIEKIDKVRFYEDDLHTLINGSKLHIPITVQRYYPNKGFQPNQTITIKLRLHKTGALQL